MVEFQGPLEAEMALLLKLEAAAVENQIHLAILICGLFTFLLSFGLSIVIYFSYADAGHVIMYNPPRCHVYWL